VITFWWPMITHQDTFDGLLWEFFNSWSYIVSKAREPKTVNSMVVNSFVNRRKFEKSMVVGFWSILSAIRSHEKCRFLPKRSPEQGWQRWAEKLLVKSSIKGISMVHQKKFSRYSGSNGQTQRYWTKFLVFEYTTNMNLIVSIS